MQPAHRLIALGLILIAAATLRLVDLGDRPMTSDELLVISRGPYSARIDTPDTANNPPLFPLLVRAVAGQSLDPLALRLPSALLGIAAVLLAFVIGRRHLGGDWAGLVAAAMIALSPACIEVSQKVRAYALAQLLCLIAFERALAAARGKGRGAWHGFAIAGAAAGWTHYLAPLMLPGAVAGVLGGGARERWRWRGLGVAGATMLVLVLPLVGAVWVGLQVRSQVPNPEDYLTQGQALMAGLRATVGSWWWVSLLLVPAGLLVGRQGNGGEESSASANANAAMAGAGVWAIMALGIPVLLSGTLMLQPDNLSFVALPVALLAGAVAARAVASRQWIVAGLVLPVLLAPLPEAGARAIGVKYLGMDPARNSARVVGTASGEVTVAVRPAAAIDLLGYHLAGLAPDELEPAFGCGAGRACRQAGRFRIVEAIPGAPVDYEWWINLDMPEAEPPAGCRWALKHHVRVARCSPVPAAVAPGPRLVLPGGVIEALGQRAGSERIDYELALPRGRLVVSVAPHDPDRKAYTRINDLDLYYWSEQPGTLTDESVSSTMELLRQALRGATVSSLGLRAEAAVASPPLGASEPRSEPPLTLPRWWLVLAVVVLLGGWRLAPRRQ